MTETKAPQTNETVMQKLTGFADLLFREVLTQRCDPEGLFCLPGLPVTNRELLASLVTERPHAEATYPLRDAWNRLLLTALTESEGEARLPKLVRLYRLD